MIKFILPLIFSFSAFHAPALAQPQEKIRGFHERAKNYLKNPGFEFGLASTTSVSAIISSGASNVHDGKSSLTIDSDSPGQIVRLKSSANPANYRGTNWLASCWVFLPSGTSTYKMGVSFDGGTTSRYQVTAAPATTSQWTKIETEFPIPSTGSTVMEITFVSVAANEPQISVDDCDFGENSKFGVAAQATFYGGMQQAGASNCAYTQNTSTGLTDFDALSTAGSCASAWTATGGVTAPAATDYKPTLTDMPAGEYMIVITGNAYNTAGDAYFRISDGTNTTGMIGLASASGATLNNTLIGRISYPTSANRTFQVEAADSAAATNGLYNEVAGRSLTWSFYRYPSSSEITYRANLSAWKVDANISGGNPSLGTSDQTAYTGITNSALTLVNNSGAGNLTAQIPCSSTNAPTGTTCAVGDESVGVSFTPPGNWTGDVRACVSFGHVNHTGAGGGIDAYFQIVETPIDSQTISQEGKSRVGSGNTTANSIVVLPNRICGNFTFSTSGQKVLRLMYEQDVTATVTNNVILGDAAAAQGQRDIHWEVYPVNENKPAPVFIGSLTTSSSGPGRDEWLTFGGVTTTGSNCTSSPCTIHSQSGWTSSVTRGSAGTYAVNYTGSFSPRPNCVITGVSFASAPTLCYVDSYGSGVINVRCVNLSGTATDSWVQMKCAGGR